MEGMTFEKVEVLSDQIVALRVTVMGRVEVQPWTLGKLRKKYNCDECHEPIKQGEMVYRPCGFPFNRYSRVHQACIDKLNIKQ